MYDQREEPSPHEKLNSSALANGETQSADAIKNTIRSDKNLIKTSSSLNSMLMLCRLTQ
ncbi:MAG: hypothetical protein ACI97K_000209 [Glaciecola sp.]|jgi:hypothetical protein